MLLRKLQWIIIFIGTAAIIPVILATIDTAITSLLSQPIYLSSLGWFQFFIASASIYFIFSVLCSLLLSPLFLITKTLPGLRNKKINPEYSVFGASFCLVLIIIVFELLNKYDVLNLRSPISIVCIILFGLVSAAISTYFIPMLSITIKDKSPELVRISIIVLKYICLTTVIISSLCMFIPRLITRDYDVNSPNLLVISIDTLRKDHTSFYGYDAIETPNIDGFLHDSTRFDKAYCSSPWTFPSFSSFLTGFEPSICGTDHTHILNENFGTFTEILYKKGYQTECYNNNWSMYPEYGFGRGFDIYAEKETIIYLRPFRGTRLYFHYMRIVKHLRSVTGTPYLYGADFISDKTVETLENTGNRPFFIWSNFFDAHTPYNPPSEFIKGGSSVAEDLLHRAAPAYKLPLDDPNLDTDALMALYDGEVTYIDKEIGRILQTLDETGHSNDTIVIIFSDHGEAFKEHGRWGHGFDVYPEVTDMLLAIRDPYQNNQCPVSNKYVSHIDMMPTILDMLGLETPDGIQGISFYGELTKPSNTSNPVLCEYTMKPFSESKAIRCDGYLFIKDYETEETYLFHIENDPMALNDISDEFPDIADDMNNKLEKKISDNFELIKRYSSGSEINLSDNDKAQLKALGYLGE